MESSKLTTLPATITIALVNLYRMTFGVVFGGRCRFYPSCSDYARQALRKYGFWKGGGLALWRLLRCHPLNPGGIDEP